MIPPNEMAAILAEAQLALDTPISIIRPTITDDGLGHKIPTYNPAAPLSNTMALFGTPQAAMLTAVAAQLGVVIQYQVMVPASTDAKAGDRIQILASGETFQVHMARQPQSYSPLLALLVTEVR